MKAFYEVQDVDEACAIAAEEQVRLEIRAEPAERLESAVVGMTARAQVRLGERVTRWGVSIGGLELLRLQLGELSLPSG